MSDNCIFCKILRGEIPASMLYRDDYCAAFLDIQPVNPGHLLVIPIAHAENLKDLDVEAGRRIFEVSQKMAVALRSADVRCEGVNLFLADGEAAGQEVFHVHMHVFPRYEHDGFGLRFGPDYENKPERESLNRIAESIRRAVG